MNKSKSKLKPKKLNILIRGYYGKNNLGDDYILYSILKMLDDLNWEPKISVFVESLGDDFSWLFPRFSNLLCQSLLISQKGHFAQTKDTRRYIKHKNLFIVGGGGLFPNLSWKMSAALYLDALLAKFHHSRFILYGIDMAKMEGHLSRFFWKKTASISEPIILRNGYSEKMLADIGIANARALTDLTFCTMTTVEKDPLKVLTLEERLGINNLKYVIFALANPFSSQEMGQSTYLSRFNLLVSELKKCRNEYETNGFKVVFLPFFAGSDSFLIQKVADVQKDIVLSENGLDLEEKRAIFIHATAVLSMRFHGIAFALYHGIPCTAICYAPKSLALMTESGLGDYAINYGIRQTDSFFKEFDLDTNQLEEINKKVILSIDKKRFEKASLILKEKSKDTSAVIEKLLETMK